MENVVKLEFPIIEDDRGNLSVYECEQNVPFIIQRVFTVTANIGEIRGNHAHKKCKQLLVCLSGKIEVTVDDGQMEEVHVLDNKGQGLLMLPGIWGKQKYLSDNAILMVLCDRVYETSDYLNNYKDFLKFKEKNIK